MYHRRAEIRVAPPARLGVWRQPGRRAGSGHGRPVPFEKRGLWKLIYQAPRYRDGVFQGLVELSLEIPESMPHFVREG